MWSGVYIGAALAAVGLAGAWLVARAASRRSNAQMRAEVAALRAELAAALARISSQEEAAAIMARVDATIAAEAEAERRNRAGLVLIRGGLLVAAAAGTAASVVSRRVQEHPVLALTATTAAAGVAGFALMWPFGGLPEAISPPKQRPPAVSAPGHHRAHACRHTDGDCHQSVNAPGQPTEAAGFGDPAADRV